MATTKSMKIQAEIDKVKAKISEQQARLKELEQQKSWEAENSEIVDIVRGMSISLTELPLLFEKAEGWWHFGTKCPEVRRRKEGGKLNMKHFRMLAAGLCSAVLLCGFAIPAYAYSDSGNKEPPVVEETPPPEPAPTITPGEGFSEDGNLVTRDLLYDAATNKQFITVETSGGNTFYIVIDYDKPVDEDGEQYHTYFLNMVDEADLLAALEAAGGELPACSCTEKMCARSHPYGLRGLRGQHDRVCWHGS